MANTGTKYKEFTGLNLPKIEEEILNQWDEEQAFEKSISLRDGKQPFVFYKGRQAPMECPAFIMLFPAH